MCSLPDIFYDSVASFANKRKARAAPGGGQRQPVFAQSHLPPLLRGGGRTKVRPEGWPAERAAGKRAGQTPCWPTAHQSASLTAPLKRGAGLRLAAEALRAAEFAEKPKPPLPCRGGGACGAGDGGVLEVCASSVRTAGFRHPSGRACARPPPLQVGEAFTSRKAKAEEHPLLGFSVISFCKLHRRPARSANASRRSLVFGQDQRNGVARPPREGFQSARRAAHLHPSAAWRRQLPPGRWPVRGGRRWGAGGPGGRCWRR